MPWNVFIAAAVERTLLDRLEADRRFSTVSSLAEADILVTRTVNAVTRELLGSAPRLRLVAQATSGFDNIDVAAAGESGVAILHLPGINANAVAELVIGHIITLTRTVPLYREQMLAGIWNRNDCTTRHELRHYRLGIVGLGNVGSRVARLARAFGMDVDAVDPYIDDFGDASRVESLARLAASCDVLTLHVPLTPETRGMVGKAEIAVMRRGTILVNAARGEVLDLDAALAALAANHLGGLAVDVFDPEPPTRQWPADPRLIVTPHIAGCTEEAKSTAGTRLYERIVQFMESGRA